MAVIGERVMVGLRAPNTGGTAYLVGAAIPELFAPGKGPAIGKVEVIELALGAGLGVRDLAPLPNGTLLVLAGPAQEQPLPYALFTLEPHQGGRLTKLATLESLADGGKAEAVTVLEARPALLRILVLFNGPEERSSARISGAAEVGAAGSLRELRDGTRNRPECTQREGLYRL